MTGRDADAPRWAGRRGRGSSSPRWGSWISGGNASPVRASRIGRRGASCQCRESVAEDIQGRGSASGRAGTTNGRRGGAVRTSSSSSSSGRCGNRTRDGGETVVSRRAREGGRGEEGIHRDATSRRDVVDPKRAGVRVPSCARSSGSSRGAARRLLLPFERAADGSEDVGGVRRSSSGVSRAFRVSEADVSRRVATIRETGMSATRGRGTNLRRTLDAEHALGRECEERVRLIVPRRLPLHHRCAHRCCSRVYRLCPETRVAALFLEVRDDSGPKGGN